MKSTNYTNKKFKQIRIIGIAFTLVCLAFPFYLHLVNQHSHSVEHSQSICPSKLLTGLPCPGCGMSKSIMYFYEGNISKSIEHHMFGTFFVFIFLFLLAKSIIELIKNKPLPSNFFTNIKTAYFFGFILMVYHVYRLIILFQNQSFDDVLKQSIWK